VGGRATRTLVQVARRSAHRHASLVSTCGSSSGSSGAIAGYFVGLVTANRGQYGHHLTSLASPLVGVMYVRKNQEFSLRNRTIVIRASKSGSFRENREGWQPCYRSVPASTHTFYPVAIESAGTCHNQAVELIQEIGRRATVITGDPKETRYLFRQLSMALQRGNTVSFQITFAAS